MRTYIDDNVSGSGFDRKGIEQIKSDISSGVINLLVVKDLSRLGRNNAKTLLFLDYLEENGVRVITYDGRYDSLKDNDTVGIDTWYNERYVRDISKKIRANIRFKIQKGEYIGNSPFGYLKSPNEKNKLIVNEAEAEVVKEIYRLYQEGWGYSRISDHLNQRGCPSPSKDRWNAVGVRRILCNRVYVGDTVQGISERISFKSKKTRRLPEDRWVITENTHEPIISKEEFYRVQEMRSKKSVYSGPHKGVIHLFRGIVYCGRCGGVMFARTRKDRPMSYICSSYGKNGRAGCTSHHIKEEELTRIVMEDITRLIDMIEVDLQLRERVEKLFAGENSQTEIEKLEKQLSLKLKQQEILYQDRLEGKISEDLFIRMNKHMEEKVGVLRGKILELKGKNLSCPDVSQIVSMLRNKLSAEGITNEIIRAVVSKIVIFDEGDCYLEKLWGDLVPLEGRENLTRFGGVVVLYNY